MNKAWKKFTIIISVLLCIMIVCLSINLVFDKLTGNMLSPVRDNNSVSDNNGGQLNNGQLNDGNYNTLPNGNNGQTPDNNPGVNPSVPDAGQQNTVPSQQQPNQNAENPLTYSKSQLIAYYNSCLKKSYSQPKVNATKTEQVDVAVSGIDIGSSGLNADKFANDIIANNTKKNGQLQAKSFVNGRSNDGTDITRFVLPANLYDGAVKSISASKSGNGYQVVFVLNQESCSHTGVAKYNASCAWPLDINVIDFGAAVTINSCTFNYPGTKITAKIDAQGRVYDTVVEMPLTVANAQAKALGINITVGEINGKWTCHNTMSF